MLRRIAGVRRFKDEPWVDWFRRSTRIARDIARRADVRFWVEAHLRAKWRWAGHVARMDPLRLAKKATTWRDSSWQEAEEQTYVYSLRLRRPRSMRWFRWEDDLRNFAKARAWQSWRDVAERKNHEDKALEWSSHCNNFIKFCMSAKRK